MTLRLDDLATRRSVPNMQLEAPGPDEETLKRILAVATRVPDHGKLVPFRFVTITGDAGARLGEAMALHHASIEPDVAGGILEKDRLRFTFAPLIITVIGRQVEHAKVPKVEQVLSAGCVAFQLLQAAQAEGFRGCWLTGWAAYDRTVMDWFGLEENENIIGFIHLGTPKINVPERDRPDAMSLVSAFDVSRLPGAV